MNGSEYPQLDLELESVPRVHRPDPDAFQRDYVQASRPVIVTGAFDHWPAVARWKDLDYLIRAAGERKAYLRVLDPSGDSSLVQTSLASYLEELRTATGPERKPRYLSELPLREVFPELLGDVPPTPYHFGSAGDFAIMMGRTTYAPLHYHPATEAVSAQVVGTKRFVLFEPKETPDLKPCPWYSNMYNFSRFDLSGGLPPEGARILSRMKGWEATLSAGEFLFIPVNWWHVVYGGSEFNILLANFFPTHVRRLHFPEPGFTVIGQMLMRSLLPGPLYLNIAKRNGLKSRVTPTMG